MLASVLGKEYYSQVSCKEGFGSRPACLVKEFISSFLISNCWGKSLLEALDVGDVSILILSDNIRKKDAEW